MLDTFKPRACLYITCGLWRLGNSVRNMGEVAVINKQSFTSIRLDSISTHCSLSIVQVCTFYLVAVIGSLPCTTFLQDHWPSFNFYEALFETYSDNYGSPEQQIVLLSMSVGIGRS